MQKRLAGTNPNCAVREADADDEAVCASYQPPLPKFSSHEDGGENGKNTRNVIQSKHDALWNPAFHGLQSRNTSGFNV